MTVCDIRSLSDVKSAIKFMYWSGLYYFYKYLGSLVDIILANGTWTFNHLEKIWYNPKLGHQLQILYPPCGTEETETTLDPSLRENKMVYLAQFRPEKRHEVILNEYNQFLKKNYPEVTEPTPEIPTIVFVGSCRTSDDTATLTKLKTQVEKLNLQKFVEFAVDVSYKEVIMWLQKCQFGLNAMWNEHFGIGVVEYMANGAIPIVHASAGPLLDIVTNPGAEGENKVWYNDVGFFFKCFEDPDLDPSIQSGSGTRVNFKSRDGQVVEYPTFSQMLTDLYLSFPDLVKDERLGKVRTAGRLSVIERFSNSAFDVKWKTCLEKLAQLESKYRQER
ncbi:uncharacterized protein SPAPADRAFT_63299 [Spathaspora passalidarum NRRL Y-27907]|uniref:GDP-Man:Man(3)GlcNAc(2)-PP-Dol alpha-1,2-mannosyltransferase n=1 Tax=Spathaspora passalidarum (strain NRRL Y-27907 / 11-Y1) TaxID=619300 RepID=G3AU99_SPAPN|nr:uncharacterized protein SPAPADRAFT_63299 [Spathaspora passalidarum NRRL Y-27907]EGW30475.1 hypothetical protein SPAPADRAFT_63299 [Spathaspora passalidarum NRRL Y-27907]